MSACPTRFRQSCARYCSWALMLVAGASNARADPTVTWLLPDFAPVALPVDGKPTNGIADQIAIFLAANWPGANHRFMFANTTRIWTMLGTDQQACHVGARYSAQRHKIAYFTMINPAPPVQVVVREESLAALPRNAQGEVDLQRLLANAALHGIVTAQRAYGDEVDRMVEERPAGSALAVMPPKNLGGSLLKMVALGNVDYTIEYDFALSYQASQNPALRSLRAVPIEGVSALGKAGVACPRTPWGKAAILRIDRILSSEAGVQALRKAGDTWITPATRAFYSKSVEAYMLKRAHPSSPAELE